MSVQRALTYTKFGLAGAIGGIALLNTALKIFGSVPTDNAESIAMGAGAVVAATLVKVLHVV